MTFGIVSFGIVTYGTITWCQKKREGVKIFELRPKSLKGLVVQNKNKIHFLKRLCFERVKQWWHFILSIDILSEVILSAVISSTVFSSAIILSEDILSEVIIISCAGN